MAVATDIPCPELHEVTLESFEGDNKIYTATKRDSCRLNSIALQSVHGLLFSVELTSTGGMFYWLDSILHAYK